LLGFSVSGRGQCRGGAFGVSGLRESDFLFITVSHCAWRHVISDMTFRVKRRCSDFEFIHIRCCCNFLKAA
jgi:hypothetical protein